MRHDVTTAATRAASALALAWVALLGAPGALAGAPATTPGQARLPPRAAALVERALDSAAVEQARDGRQLFESVLGSEAFASGSAGPFDIHVLVADGIRNPKEAQRLVAELVESLQPAAALVTRLWPAGGDGLISAARLPIVIADSGSGQTGFSELVSLLDHCERQGYSGWAPANVVDSLDNLAAEVVRTWDVQLFNLAHETIADRREGWIEHGVGYYALAFVANRALRRGAWGLVPPWLANGLIDELDIEAHGRAWVGQESWSRQQPGWFRPGWSGFVPIGSSPPPPVTGPPANLAVTVVKTGDPWLDFDESETRHWTTLVADRKSDAPASFTLAAECESFLPRDRAAARCLMHLLLELAPGESGPFTGLLDREVQTPSDGMPDSEALTVLFARALGGVPEVDRLESLDTRALLVELKRIDLIALFESTGSEALLTMSDHREQSRWLSRRAGFDQATRTAIFQAVLEVEHYQQMAEWKAMAPRLDNGLAAVLAAAKRYPQRDRDRGAVAEALRSGLAQEPAVVEDAKPAKGRRGKR